MLLAGKKSAVSPCYCNFRKLERIFLLRKFLACKQTNHHYIFPLSVDTNWETEEVKIWRNNLSISVLFMFHDHHVLVLQTVKMVGNCMLRFYKGIGVLWNCWTYPSGPASLLLQIASSPQRWSDDFGRWKWRWIPNEVPCSKNWS